MPFMTPKRERPACIIARKETEDFRAVENHFNEDTF
jgi:hypothetical protein